MRRGEHRGQIDVSGKAVVRCWLMLGEWWSGLLLFLLLLQLLQAQQLLQRAGKLLLWDRVRLRGRWRGSR